MENIANEVNKPYLLYMIIELVLLLLPICTLIWKAAKQAGKMDDMKDDFQELKKRVELNEKRVEDNEKQSAKDMIEIRNSIAAIDKRTGEIYTSIQFIKDSIAELKAINKGN